MMEAFPCCRVLISLSSWKILGSLLPLNLSSNSFRILREVVAYKKASKNSLVMELRIDDVIKQSFLYQLWYSLDCPSGVKLSFKMKSILAFAIRALWIILPQGRQFSPSKVVVTNTIFLFSLFPTAGFEVESYSSSTIVWFNGSKELKLFFLLAIEALIPWKRRLGIKKADMNIVNDWTRWRTIEGKTLINRLIY